MRHAKGLENFGLAIIQSLAPEVGEVTVDVCKPSRAAYEKMCAGHANISFVHDPIQGFVATMSEKGKLGGLFPRVAQTRTCALLFRNRKELF
jgi:hypothetical protein